MREYLSMSLAATGVSRENHLFINKFVAVAKTVAASCKDIFSLSVLLFSLRCVSLSVFIAYLNLMKALSSSYHKLLCKMYLSSHFSCIETSLLLDRLDAT